jgi:hypothetical protein
MIVLVSDTSVLIDLERGQLLEPCFRLPCEFAVPDLLYKRELADYGGPQWVERGLRIEELTKDELLIVQQVRGVHGKLSVPDAYAYALAQSRKWTLLTGDGELREIARNRSMPFHGVLWVLDQLYDGKAMAIDALVAGLQAIGDHPRCRLPRAEIQSRLTRYRTGEKS